MRFDREKHLGRIARGRAAVEQGKAGGQGGRGRGLRPDVGREGPGKGGQTGQRRTTARGQRDHEQQHEGAVPAMAADKRTQPANQSLPGHARRPRGSGLVSIIARAQRFAYAGPVGRGAAAV